MAISAFMHITATIACAQWAIGLVKKTGKYGVAVVKRHDTLIVPKLSKQVREQAKNNDSFIQAFLGTNKVWYR